MKADLWLPVLKQELQGLGEALLIWEIFRGDSFQCMLKPEIALEKAILIKAKIKQFSVLDVRIGIGIGDISYQSERITECNGTAFVNSGTSFDALKKYTLGLKTPWKEFDEPMGIMLQVASFIMDSWSAKESIFIYERLRSPDLSQKDLAQRMQKSQSTVSDALKRSGYNEIEAVLEYYRKRVGKLCQSS
ncbi:hypothetical protein [Gracilinema caldarium]|uniref:hypothetical protein n=1 Tax=Gracilinema caldarium TaxID=215591 RepID=UPI0026EDC412|nr:hypothetical protein [Gracilinema caldarium]